jgi:hypothetical protein
VQNQGHATKTKVRDNGQAAAGGAKSGAVSPDPSPDNPDLARIVATWPKLPESIRRALLALIETALPVAPATPHKAAE